MKKCLRFVVPILVILISFIKVSVSSPSLASDCSLSTPTQFSAVTSSHAGEVALYWDQVPGATRYALAYGITSGHYIYGANHIGEESSRSYTVSLLNPGTTYYFVLSAGNDSCGGPFSHEAIAVSAGGTNPQWSSTSMSSPSLQAQPGANSGEVNLSWNDVSEATNYHLVYGTTQEVNQYGALNIGKQTHYTVSKLNPNEKYYFSVIPVKNDQVMSLIGPVSTYSTIEGKINLTVPTDKVLPMVTPSPTMILKDVPTTKATPTQTQAIRPTQFPIVTLKSTPIPTRTQAPQISSGPSYFVP